MVGGGSGFPGDNFAAFADTFCGSTVGTGGMDLICDVACFSGSPPTPGWYFDLRSAGGYGLIYDAFVPFGGSMINIPNLITSCGTFIDAFGTHWDAIGYGGTASLILP